MQEAHHRKPAAPDPEEMLDEALAEPVVTGESHIAEAQMLAAAFLVLAAGAAAYSNSWLPLRVEPSALLLHLAAALAMFAVARRVLSLRTELPAMACGILFAVHPLAVTAVQTGALRILAATLLGLLALALFLAATSADRVNIDMRRIALALLLYAAAALMDPVLLALALVFPAAHAVRSPRPAHGAMPMVYGTLALVVASLAVAMPYLHAAGGDWQAFSAACRRAFALLLGLAPLSVWHPAREAAAGPLASAFPIALTAIAILAAARARSPLAPALLWLLLATGATACITRLDLAHEAALYPALAGLALAFGAILVTLGRVALLGTAAGIAAMALLVLIGLASYGRNAELNEPLAPWRAAAEIYPRAVEPRLVLARALLEQGREALGGDAIARGQAPGVLRAGDARSHFQSALRHAEDALDLDPESVDAMLLQGQIMLQLGRGGEVADSLFMALRHAPWRLDIARALADTYAAMPGHDAALKAADYYASVVARNPDDADSRRAYLAHLHRHELLGRMALMDRADVPNAFLPAVRAMAERDQQAVQAFQGNAFAPAGLLAYAKARIERAQPVQAAYALHEVLRREPQNEEAWKALAALAADAGDHAAFAQDFAGAAPPVQWHAAAVRQAADGRWPAAEAFLHNADLGAPERWLTLADLAIDHGARERAERYLEQAADSGAPAEAIALRRARLPEGTP